MKVYPLRLSCYLYNEITQSKLPESHRKCIMCKTILTIELKRRYVVGLLHNSTTNDVRYCFFCHKCTPVNWLFTHETSLNSMAIFVTKFKANYSSDMDIGAFLGVLNKSLSVKLFSATIKDHGLCFSCGDYLKKKKKEKWTCTECHVASYCSEVCYLIDEQRHRRLQCFKDFFVFEK